MFLVNWLQANLLMVLTTIVLIGIPAVILVIVFRNQRNEPEDGPVE